MASRGVIPGYVFDEKKGKYFPIQPNHIAPKSAVYSESAVKAKGKAQILAKVNDQRQKRRELGRVSRSKLRTPLLNSSLNTRLGFHRIAPSTTRLFASFYADALSRTDAVVGKDSGDELIGFSTLNSSLHVSWRNLGRRGSFYCHSTDTQYPAYDVVRTPYNFKRMAAAGPNHIVLAGGHGFSIYRSDDDPTNWQTWSAEFPSQVYSKDLSVSPDGRSLAFITAHDNIARYEFDSLSILAMGYSSPSPIGRGDYMVASYVDDNTLLAGDRSGGLHLSDYRVNATIHRLQHSSAPNGIHARNSNEIIVSGLQSIALYDLRYVKDSPSLYHPADCSKCARFSKRAKRAHQRCLNSTYTATLPLVNFNASPDRLSQHYTDAGKSLAYISSLDIAVIASHSTNSVTAYDGKDRRPTSADRITLYQASTGRVLPSIFDDLVYEDEIRQVGVHRMRDGPESILVCTSKRLQEFRVDLPRNGQDLFDDSDRDDGYENNRQKAKRRKYDSTRRIAVEENRTEFKIIEQRFPQDAQLGMAQKWDEGDIPT